MPGLHHQVRRFDVAVGESDVPHPPDHLEPLVDHAVVDLDVADLLAAVEELHRDQVLALGSDLNDAEGRRRGKAVVAQEAERVVLVLDEATDGLERRLVFETPVQHRPA